MFKSLVASLLLVFSLALLVSSSLAEKPPRTASNSSEMRLEKQISLLDASIAKEQSRLKKVKRERSKLETEYKKILDELSSAEAKKGAIHKRVKNLGTAIAEIEQNSLTIQADMKLLSKRYLQRVVGTYKMQRRSSSLDYLFNSRSAIDLLRRGHFLSIIAKSDRQLLSALESTVETLKASIDDLKKSRVERQKSLRELQGVMLSLERDRTRKSSVLEKIKKKQSRVQQSLAALKSKAVSLQKVVGVLIVSGEKKASEIIKKQPKAAVKFSGKGLKQFKGRLSFPVNGRLVQGYGKRKHEEFKDILFSKGYEIAVDSSSLVKAIANGKVILDRELPGYGKVLIIDHGMRYYSLYGRLAEPRLDVGAVASASQAVGATSNLAPSDESNFYFELRHKGKAVNPAPFFSKVPK